ncbi:polyprenol phosphomannose-dependent alpha 1,6 mannosyltransferase MptB [Rhodococcus sp. IEGM 1408]|uniref:polyprenol phosphomannose-dependent alpha 1,6 mannosyltransferase MptB n=1 Tax=Rhodococcus sp. IEGM 1408 TaxID=3082220 RepID=UPI00295511CB|nr:polyprenol phosphomannose-dependent alpha 1,6 mannosyltransferase MptB [Rhodococcus sp. IEGM 1408]MDV8000268.1 polyprenol phosphomannose-dependent alpha 1,6 mannosyltransferase MptB [Rhodococcus sp. IEGM 1408]
MTPLLPGRGAGSVASRLHTDEQFTGVASTVELARLRRIRRIGTTAAVGMAIGALGAGALPVLQNPIAGERLFGLWLRLQQSSMTVVMTGMVVVTLCWLLLAPYVLGRDLRGRLSGRIDRATLDRIIASWALPLALAPPMFSKDVYSYLAQGAIGNTLADPYALGPVSALGTSHALTVNVPDIWRDTPNQYGPLFLGVQKAVHSLTGDDVVVGTILHRVVAVLGILMLGWAVPRLAEYCGVSDVAALWLAVANPLVLFHLVSGIHSESLMMGLLAVGLVLALRAIDSPDSGRRTALLFVLGTVLVTGSALVKLPTVVALGFVGMALARRWGGGWWATVRAAVVMLVISGATTGLAMLATSSGLGWITKLGAATSLRSWLSPPTALGVIVGGIGQFLGLGDHTAQILVMVQAAALVVAGAVTVRMLFAVQAGRINPVGGLGLSMAAIVLCFPVVQPWYVLWALIPLAAWASRMAFRVPVVAVSAVLACFTLPPGAGLPPFVTIQAWAATVVAVAALLIALFRWPGLLRFT